MTRYTLTDIIMCKRHQSSTWQTESVRHRDGCRELNALFVILILVRFLCSDKEILFSRTQDDVKLKYYY